ncbi:hypothetical protein [Vibrio sp. 10N.239.312.D08]|uniref:hypothetical protein n=1 Tax=Vibrio sp. 10N.239.312.D08 TaxID=3229978 RepID=UPI00354BF897
MMNASRKYHASWIEAAERGEISWETVTMLIEAFELGVAECVEELSLTNKSATQVADEALKIKNDTFQYIQNVGKEISYPPSGLNRMYRIGEIVNELGSTINFCSRRIHSDLRIISLSSE